MSDEKHLRGIRENLQHGEQHLPTRPHARTASAGEARHWYCRFVADHRAVERTRTNTPLSTFATNNSPLQPEWQIRVFPSTLCRPDTSR